MKVLEKPEEASLPQLQLEPADANSVMNTLFSYLCRNGVMVSTWAGLLNHKPDIGYSWVKQQKSFMRVATGRFFNEEEPLRMAIVQTSGLYTRNSYVVVRYFADGRFSVYRQICNEANWIHVITVKLTNGGGFMAAMEGVRAIVQQQLDHMETYLGV